MEEPKPVRARRNRPKTAERRTARTYELPQSVPNFARRNYPIGEGCYRRNPYPCAE